LTIDFVKAKIKNIIIQEEIYMQPTLIDRYF